MDTTVPTTRYSLDHLSDAELLSSTRGLVAGSNQLLAAQLAHLAEVEARGIHRERACASLYTYCIYELRMSEDAAFRRARAARIARQFPILLDQIAAGEIHLTAILMLGPHLTEANHREVLARAKHRTKKEIAQLVRVLDPLPEVPARVEPLGPAARIPAAPKSATWAAFVASLCPAVRELPPAERPRNWGDAPTNCVDAVENAVEDAVRDADQDAVEADGPISDPEPLSLGPQRYKVQFTATQEYVDLLEQAKDLLSHAVPDGSIEEVHLRAMRALVAELKKRKYAVTDKPRPQTSQPAGDSDPESPLQRGRGVAAAVRRAVWKRDGGRCTYVDETGQRCRETSRLELHHEEAYARGGPPTEENLSLRCRAHNALAAEQDFGREFVAERRADRAPRQRGSSEGGDCEGCDSVDRERDSS
jgi:hypothetical protein